MNTQSRSMTVSYFVDDKEALNGVVRHDKNGPYSVLEIGEVTFFGFSSDQLEELAVQCRQTASALRRAQQEIHRDRDDAMVEARGEL